MIGYKELRQKIGGLSVQDYPEFVNKNADERMSLVTADDDLARKLDFKITDWIKQSPEANLGEDFAHYQSSSNGFDYNSIMIYGSYANAASEEHTVNNAVMTRRGQTGPMMELLQGGSSDAREARLSDMDIERVVQLYPMPKSQASGSRSRGSKSG